VEQQQDDPADEEAHRERRGERGGGAGRGGRAAGAGEGRRQLGDRKPDGSSGRLRCTNSATNVPASPGKRGDAAQDSTRAFAVI
jgi:hypothetical protein